MFRSEASACISWHINHHNVTGFGFWGGGGGRGSSLHAFIEDTRETTVPYVWYSIQRRSVHSTPSPLCVCVFMCVCGICTVTVVVFRHTGGIYCADLIFEEVMIFWQDRALPHFYTMDESKVTIEMDLHGSPCLPDLIALDFFFLDT